MSALADRKFYQPVSDLNAGSNDMNIQWNDSQLYQRLAAWQEQGRQGVLLTVVEAGQGAPAQVGAKMALLDDGQTLGTIGGGAMEQWMLQAARRVLADGQPRLERWPAAGADQAGKCGGRVTVFLDPLGRGPRLAIIGAGHVGRAVAGLALVCGWRITVVDDRTGLEEAGLPICRCTEYDRAVAELELDDRAAVLICTRSHETDLAALQGALSTGAGFIGLLGSRRKWQQFSRILSEEGVPIQELERVHTPVGLDIGARTPAEIGIAVMAQLIGFHRKGEV